MLLEKALKDFLEFHEVGNQSRYTIRNYRDYVGSFVEWLKSAHGMTDTDELRVVHLRGWIAYFQKVPGERGKMLKIARSICRVCASWRFAIGWSKRRL